MDADPYLAGMEFVSLLNRFQQTRTPRLLASPSLHGLEARENVISVSRIIMLDVQIPANKASMYHYKT